VKWKQFLKPAKSLNAEQAKTFIAQHRSDAFTLLDVRQPHEYERERIPGAKLIPLPELMDRRHELDPDRPMLVYCAVGGRSRVAVQLLAGQGFSDVINLQGGISAWLGRKASGPVLEEGLMLPENSGLEEVCRLAYTLEDGLQRFYARLGEDAEGRDIGRRFHRLGAIELVHKQKILAMYQKITGSRLRENDPPRKIPDIRMEGGWNLKHFLESNRAAMQSVQDVINLAMVIETQALDLYLRWAGESRDAGVRGFFFALADEEKAHLRRLGDISDPEDFDQAWKTMQDSN
jgi:rhodanese-related sulfurtransferase/rubrerythrin